MVILASVAKTKKKIINDHLVHFSIVKSLTVV